MGVGSCRWCRVGRFYYDSNKHFSDHHLCFDCSIICDLNIQHLVPASERLKSNQIFPRSAHRKVKAPVLGGLGRSSPY